MLKKTLTNIFGGTIMGFTIKSIEDVNTVEKFYSLLMGGKDSEESFFDSFFVPDIDMKKFFKYLLSEEIIHKNIYNNIIKNIKECESNDSLEDEDYYLISIGVTPMHIKENDSENNYLLFGTDESLDNINAYWYLLLSYIFNNKDSDDEVSDAFHSLCNDAFDCYQDSSRIRCEWYKIPNNFDFFGMIFNTKKLIDLENILTDCLNMTDDEMLKDLLENALATLE